MAGEPLKYLQSEAEMNTKILVLFALLQVLVAVSSADMEEESVSCTLDFDPTRSLAYSLFVPYRNLKVVQIIIIIISHIRKF